MELRHATIADLELLCHWDTQPHVIEARSHDVWNWAVELRDRPAWREQWVAMVESEPVGFVQIIDPALEETHYWGAVPDNLRAIDLWIGEARNMRRGFGTAMMHLALARCFADASVQAVLVDPLADNVRAHCFYAKLGFALREQRRFGHDHCHVYQMEREAYARMVDRR